MNGWKEIKKSLIRNTGFNSIPVVKVKLISLANNYELILEHDCDGRELHLEYLENTLKYIHQLWGRTVTVKTKLAGSNHLCYYNSEGFKAQSM